MLYKLCCMSDFKIDRINTLQSLFLVLFYTSTSECHIIEIITQKKKKKKEDPRKIFCYHTLWKNVHTTC